MKKSNVRKNWVTNTMKDIRDNEKVNFEPTTDKVDNMLPYVVSSIIRLLNYKYDLAIKDGNLELARAIEEKQAYLIIKMLLLEDNYREEK